MDATIVISRRVVGYIYPAPGGWCWAIETYVRGAEGFAAAPMTTLSSVETYADRAAAQAALEQTDAALLAGAHPDSLGHYEIV